jgi:chromosome partitioning protein
MAEPRIIAVANQKGGVGKTTTAVNLAAALAAVGERVLLVDMDPQGNATMGCGVDKHEITQGTYEALLGDCQVADALVHCAESDLTVVPANGDLTAAEVALLNHADGPRRLQKVLSGVAGQYQHVFIDCPPSLNMLTLNALVAANRLLIPIQCEYYALEGLSALLDTVERVRRTLNPRLRIEGLLRTMFDSRNRLANEVSSQLTRHFGERVYRTVVPRNVRLAEAPSYGLPIALYDRSSRGARAYRDLAREILRRDRGDAGPVTATRAL